jgi:hypothetical protein
VIQTNVTVLTTRCKAVTQQAECYSEYRGTSSER